MAESKKIKGSDLIAPNFLTDSIVQAEKFLKVIKDTKQVIIDTNKITSKQLGGAKGSTSAALKEQNKLMDESVKQRSMLAKAEAAEIKATLDLEKAKKSLADFEKKRTADIEKERKAIEQQNSAYAKASKQLNELRRQYKDLAITGKEADKESQALLKTIQDLDKALKKADADVGQFNRHVGDYKNQVKEAITETGVFTEGMNKLGHEQSQVIAGLGGIIGQLKLLKKGQDEATVSASRLNRTLKAIGIAAIIAALASVFAFFTSSREGALEFDLLLNKIKATIDILIGSFAKLGKGLILQFKSWSYYLTGLKEDLKSPFKESVKAQEAYRQSAKLSQEATELMSTAFDGNADAIIAQSAEYDKLTRAIFEFEDQLRILQVTQEKFRMDEEDFNEIAADNTISLNKQKAALEGAINARLNAAKIGREIADKELAISKMQIELELRKNKVSEADIALAKKKGFEHLTEGKLSIKVSNEALNAVHEKYLADLKAADVLDDLDRQEAERRRQIIQTETIANIELIRSKKLGADEQVKILTKQVADEKNQLEEREKFEQELRGRQIDAQNEEIKLLGNFGLKAAEINDLINEKDAVKLANTLKNLRATRLSQEATDELAKVILEAQTNELAYQDQLAKFEDERIKREQKILLLNREISVINEQSVLNEVENIEQQKQKILDDSNNKILQSNNVFNRKLLNQRQQAFDETAVLLDEEFKIKEDLLNKQYQIDQDNIKNSVSDEMIRDKELEKLRASYMANVNKLENDNNNKNKDFLDKELAQQKAIEIKKIEIIDTALAQATQALSTELDKRNAIQDQKIDQQLQKTESAIEQQRELAARGLANTLAFQQAELDKERLRQQDQQKREAKQKENLALAEALLNAYNSELKQPNANPTTAAAKAFADVLLFKGLAAGLVQFAADGEDRVKGPGTRTSDSVPFMLSVDEGVVKASANMNHPGVVSALNSDTFDQMYIPRYDFKSMGMADNISNSIGLQNNREIVSLLTEIRNKPVQQIDVDKFGNLIETVYDKGIKTVTKYKIRKGRYS